MKEKQNNKQSWKSLYNILSHNIPWLWYIANLAISLSFGTLSIKLMKTQAEIMAGNIFDKSIIMDYIGATFVLYIVMIVISLSGEWANIWTDRKIQRKLWRKLIHMPMEEYNKQNPSGLISRLTDDTTKVTYALSYVMSLITTTYTLVLMLKNMYGMNKVITLSLLFVIPYILLVMVVPGRIYFNIQKRMQDTLSSFTNYVAERLSNIRLVKSSATESHEVQLGYECAEKNYKAEVKLAVVNAIISPFKSSTQGILYAIVLIMGAIFVDRGELEMRSVITMFIFVQNMQGNFMTYIDCYHELKKTHGATDVIGNILGLGVEEVKREKSFTDPDADIRLENVSFKYNTQDVLSNVDMVIPKGKVTAIVGPSGSGKTTILSLLERLYVPQGGRIKFGDTEVESINLDEWRNATGYIQQNSPLLSGTIRDNITYGMDRDVRNEEVFRAAKLANAYDFIMKLPEGFNTNIGQLGGKLSGGERQRIALARMIIKNPDYLLLDEATSSLDAENESQVQAALDNIMKGKTAVVVAHNMKTVVNADNIIVLDSGKVQASGKHDELYKKNNLYRQYFDLQFNN